jgi:replicative DNA helicase
MQIDSDKLWSVSAEGGVLGSVLFNENCFDSILTILPDEDYFFDERNRLIYSALVKLYTEKTGIDAVTLREELERFGNTDKAGGVEYLQEILNTTPSSANAVYYAKRVREKYQYRNLISSIEKMQNVVEEPIPVGEAIEKVHDIALAIETGKAETEFFTLADHAMKIAEQAEGQQAVIPTGFKNIDDIIQGVSPGDLCIVAGRPSMGKSALALDIITNMAQRGLSIVFFTLEMPHRGIIERAFVRTGLVTMPRIRQGLSDYEKGKAKEAASELEKLDILFHETGDTPKKQGAFIRARKKSHKIDVVVVDYLQLMHTGGRIENKTQEVTAISWGLKRIAMQEKVPVIALSQLNRLVENRTNHRPRMSDLRESGSIEQDADFVMLLHREDYYRRNDNPNTEDLDGSAELIIAKARNCPTGIAKLAFLSERIMFGDSSRAVCE